MNKLKSNQSGIAHLAAILAVVVLVAIAAVGWKVYDNQKSKTSDSTAATPKTTTPAAKVSQPTTTAPVAAKTPVDAEAQGWALLTSGKKGFTIRIPDGWTIRNDTTSDYAFTQDLGYVKGKKAVITNEEALGNDTIFRFSVAQYKDSENVDLLRGQSKDGEFKTDSLTGTRYYEKYAVEKQTGIGPYSGMESYIYTFHKGSATTYVTYNIFNYNQYSKDIIGITKSDTNQLDLVERAVKTLTIN